MPSEEYINRENLLLGERKVKQELKRQRAGLWQFEREIMLLTKRMQELRELKRMRESLELERMLEPRRKQMSIRQMMVIQLQLRERVLVEELEQGQTTQDRQKRFLHAFTRIFPANFREEYFGDLEEEISKMKKENYRAFSIWAVIIGRSLTAFVILLKVKFQDIRPANRTPDD